MEDIGTLVLGPPDDEDHVVEVLDTGAPAAAAAADPASPTTSPETTVETGCPKGLLKVLGGRTGG